jgi:hypothetical protein
VSVHGKKKVVVKLQDESSSPSASGITVVEK